MARDHLANERTFLAWLRTSLGFASGGIAITQLIKIAHELNARQANPNLIEKVILIKHRTLEAYLGSSFVVAAMIILMVGLWRYFAARHWLQMGVFPASRGSVLTTFAISFFLIATSFGLVVSVDV